MSLPAAAAGSTGDFAGDASVSRSLPSGLLSRTGSSLRAEGDRERRSNLEVFRGSGSFWSNRDRLAVRRSVSSISRTELTPFVLMSENRWKKVSKNAVVIRGWNFWLKSKRARTSKMYLLRVNMGLLTSSTYIRYCSILLSLVHWPKHSHFL